MFACPNGHPVPEANRFCHQCGATMVELPVEPEPVVERAAWFPLHETYGETPPLADSQGSTSQRSSNTAVYALAGVIVVLAVAGALAALLMNGDGTSESPTSRQPQDTASVAGGSATPSQTASRGPLPSEASACSGTLPGDRPFGHVGDPAASSCDFIRNAFQAYSVAPGGGPYTVHSNATNRDYDNVTCTPRDGWVYCQGGRPDAHGNPSAKMYFAQH